MRPEDTSSEAWEVQLNIYRHVSPAKRLAISAGLTDLSRKLLEAGIREQHPSYSEEEVKRETIRLWLQNDRLYQEVYKDRLSKKGS